LHHHGRGHPVGTAVDPGHQPEEELAYPVGLLVNTLENLAFDLHGHEPMAVGRFDAQIADLNAGKWYFNVHTAAHKGGEIRGQLAKAP